MHALHTHSDALLAGGLDLRRTEQEGGARQSPRRAKRCTPRGPCHRCAHLLLALVALQLLKLCAGQRGQLGAAGAALGCGVRHLQVAAVLRRVCVSMG